MCNWNSKICFLNQYFNVTQIATILKLPSLKFSSYDTQFLILFMAAIYSAVAIKCMYTHLLPVFVLSEAESAIPMLEHQRRALPRPSNHHHLASQSPSPQSPSSPSSPHITIESSRSSKLHYLAKGAEVWKIQYSIFSLFDCYSSPLLSVAALLYAPVLLEG